MGVGSLCDGQWSPPFASISRVGSAGSGLLQQDNGVRRAPATSCTPYNLDHDAPGKWALWTEGSRRVYRGKNEAELLLASTTWRPASPSWQPKASDRPCFQRLPPLSSEVIISQCWLPRCHQAGQPVPPEGLLVLKSKKLSLRVSWAAPSTGPLTSSFDDLSGGF